MKSVKQRNANLDLLRIVSMILIVFLHSIDHSGVLENADSCGTGMYFYVRLTHALCQVCVNIYIMLSGYFMINSTFRLHKLVVLWMEAVFYSFSLKLLFMALGLAEMSVLSLASCFFPILTGRYWFLTIYVGMYLVAPFMNILIRAMDKHRHAMLNLCMFAIMSLWSSIHPAFSGMNSGGGWGIAWFVVLYITAAWFRLYYAPNGKVVRWLLGYLFVPLMIAVGQVISRALNIGAAQQVISNWLRYDSAPVYIMTLCLFVGFLNIRISGEKISRAICGVAPLTLGVYLIHFHANVSPWLWEMLNLPEKMESALFPLIQLGVVLGIFWICILLSALRKNTIGRIEDSQCMKMLCEKTTGCVSGMLERYITGR